MTTKSSFIRTYALAGGISLATVIGASGATLLEFDGLAGNSNPVSMDEAYGDNISASASGITASAGIQGVVGTPDIALAWNTASPGGAWDSYASWDGRGPVAQTEYNNGNVSMSFTPTATTGALITSFVLDEFAPGAATDTNTVISWRILNGASVIVFGTENGLSDAAGVNGGRVTVNTGMTEAQAIANVGDVLTLELVRISGAGSYQALDNLSFDQVAIPEPSTSLLAAAGLGAMALRRRRK